jgi:hypothetical protein
VTAGRRLESTIQAHEQWELADVTKIGIESNSIVENLGTLGDIMIYTLFFSLLIQPLRCLKDSCAM